MTDNLFSDAQLHYQEKRERYEAEEAQRFAVERQTNALERIATALELLASCVETRPFASGNGTVNIFRGSDYDRP
jgi:hypothetical protein